MISVIFSVEYRKIPNLSPRAYIIQRLFLRSLYSEGNLHFKSDWASLIVGSKFPVFALFYFVFEGKYPSTSPRGAYIWMGDLTEGFLRYRFGGLISAHSGAPRIRKCGKLPIRENLVVK